MMKNEKLLKLVLTGVFAALSYVVFTFLQIKITLPGGDATSIHLGNAVCVLGALLLGGLYGGLGGAIGMTIGDLFDPVYIVYAPKTFILKLCIGLITGFIAHRLGHITTENNHSKIFRWTVVAAAGILLQTAHSGQTCGRTDISLECGVHIHQRRHFTGCIRSRLHGPSPCAQEIRHVSDHRHTEKSRIAGGRKTKGGLEEYFSQAALCHKA